MSTKKSHIQAAKNGNMARVEHTEVHDDNLLPDAAEIAKLKEIDPDILTWLKATAEKEQNFRHKAFFERTSIVDNHNSRGHNTARYGLTIYFLLVAGAGVASFILLRDGHNVQGSIFGGAAGLLALAVLVTKKAPTSPTEETKNNK